MTPPSPDLIASKRQQGCDPERLKTEILRLEYYEEGLALCPVIEGAFAEVTLGTGIGLFEAQGLDDYADDATRATYRENDEKEDWRKIPPEALQHCNSSLCFFDAEGMRFHLPAYMHCELRGEYGYDLASFLAQSYTTLPEQFGLLNGQQRIAIRQFLLHALLDPDHAEARHHIAKALDDYWTWPAEPK